jgi:hypothetical protein
MNAKTLEKKMVLPIEDEALDVKLTFLFFTLALKF